MALTRRNILAGAIGLTSSELFSAIDRALALPASRKTGTLKDVEHVVILMQENRSFDHYFGTLGGVRGFDDRAVVPARRGRSVWEQSDGHGVFTTPFLMDGSHTAAQHIKSLPHSWSDGHAAWNHGLNNKWIPAKGHMAMASYGRSDLPFHYALADAFTICDGYHCSIPSATNPNRSFMWTGTIDPYGAKGGPMHLQPKEDATFHLRSETRFSWTTYPERLEAAGINWAIYQGIDATGPFRADPQDAIAPRNGSVLANTDSSVSCFNTLRFFKSYDEADARSPLYQRAMRHRPPSTFAADARLGRLPAVSWICPPFIASEHPKQTPAEGAVFIASVLNALTANPDTWSRTVLLIVYDESDGFFDHVLPPTPPASSSEGLSNVDTKGEIHDDGLPYGLGPRVPMIVISPWSRGGAVCSQTFDHTSIIRFLETRFGVMEPNISAWRRSICGDLTATLDFSGTELELSPLPEVGGFIAAVESQASLPGVEIPTSQRRPTQERAHRRYRAIPYRFEVSVADVSPNGVRLHFQNDGAAGAAFHVFDRTTDLPPRRYTLAASSELSDTWICADDGRYELYILGPASFLRHFRGCQGAIMVQLEQLPAKLRVTIRNSSKQSERVTLADLAYGESTKTLVISGETTRRTSWDIDRSDGWYDLEISASKDGLITHRFAGHVENGKPSWSDPQMA